MISKNFVVVSIICLVFALTACEPQPRNSYGPYQGGYSGPSGEEGPCGHLNQPCCQDMEHRDIYGNWQPISFCYDYLDSRADTCVEGPEYEAYDRNADTNY